MEPAAVVRPSAHPGDVDLGEVHRGVPLDDPFRERLPRSGAVDDPLRVEAGRDPETRHLGELPQVEVGVGREALGRAEVVGEAQVVQHRQPFARVREHGREVIPVLTEFDEAAGRDVARRLGLPFRADEEPAAVVADVQVAVQVAEDREPVLRDLRLVRHHPDVLRRVERHRRAGEPRQLGRPEAGRQHRDLALDRPSVRDHAGHAATVLHEPGDPRAEHERRPVIFGALRHRERGVARVHGRVGREDRRADEVLDLGRGPVRRHVLGSTSWAGQYQLHRAG